MGRGDNGYMKEEQTSGVMGHRDNGDARQEWSREVMWTWETQLSIFI